MTTASADARNTSEPKTRLGFALRALLSRARTLAWRALGPCPASWDLLDSDPPMPANRSELWQAIPGGWDAWQSALEARRLEREHAGSVDRAYAEGLAHLLPLVATPSGPSSLSSSSLSSQQPPSDQAACQASALERDLQAAAPESSIETLITPQILAAALRAIRPHLNEDGHLDSISSREAIREALVAGFQGIAEGARRASRVPD